MIELRGSAGFRLKSLDVRRRSELAGENHLERDDSIERSLPSSINDAHSAAGDLFEKFVIGEERLELFNRRRVETAPLLSDIQRRLRHGLGGELPARARGDACDLHA